MMMTRQTVLRTAFAAGLVSVAVAGCGMMQPAQKIDIYEATLTGTQEVPPNTSAGRGTAEIQYNSSNNTLSWKVTYSGLSGPVTGAHIHGPAAVGANAGIVVPFSATSVRSRSRARPPSRPRSSATWPRACGT